MDTLLVTVVSHRSAFFICGLPRSGSYLLCELLTKTGVAGRPTEYGVVHDEMTWRHFHRFDDHEKYFAHSIDELCLSSNGVFSAKMMFEQMRLFSADLKRYRSIDGRCMMDVVDRVFSRPRYVQLKRRDKERQAISFARAMQTGAWNSAQVPKCEPYYDPALIAQAEVILARQEEGWNNALRGIEQTRKATLFYEDMVSDLQYSTWDLLKWLEIPEKPKPFGQPTLQRQSDSVSKLWCEQWRKDKSFYKSQFITGK